MHRRMATASRKLFCLVIFFFVFLFLQQPNIGEARKLLNPVGNGGKGLHRCEFDQIYQLGDSISDTGNLVTESPNGGGALFNRLPYGITLGKPTGRCSNGLLMIDYFAMAFRLPYLHAYEKVEGANFRHGVNFAVAGATALPIETLEAKGIHLGFPTNSSLDVQLQWMSSHLDYLCQSRQDCQTLLRKSLFFVGEIGGNDFNYALVGNKTVDELNALIPEVVESIAEAVRRVISFGATNIIVPGNFPIGCLPIYLSSFPVDDPRAYDANQCLVGLNRLAAMHNDVLQAAIIELKKEYPSTAIVYADYYNAYLSVLNNAPRLGFEDKFSACCGSGESNNFSIDKLCGIPGVTACPNPNNHMSWDGIHMTQQAYKFMTGYLLRSIIPQLQCN